MGWLKYLLLFLLFFIIGFSVRFLFFGLYQIPEGKEYFQELPLIQDQGGSETPELAWQNYLNALKNNDIESALQQVWPYERGRVRDFLSRLREVNYLNEFVKNIKERGLQKRNENLYEIKITSFITNEVQYAYSGNWNLVVPEDNGPVDGGYKIKLNPHNQRWYISFFGDQF